MSRSTTGRGRERRCLGPELTAYADRALRPDELRSWDLHLVACTACRQAVEAERRVLAALRGPAGPAVPSDLRAVLMSMASAAAPPQQAVAWAAESPPQPLRIPPPPVPVVDRCAPAQHRSVMRATVFAGLAAGASAAAAWSFAVVGSPLAPTGPSPAAPSPAAPGTAVLRARPVTPSATNASFGSGSFSTSLRARAAMPTTATTVLFGGAGRPVVSGAQRGSAESLP